MNIFDEAVKLLEEAEVKNKIIEVPETKSTEAIKPKKVSVMKPRPLTKEEETELEKARLAKAEIYRKLLDSQRRIKKTADEIIVSSLETLRAEGLRMMEENKEKKEIRLKEKNELLKSKITHACLDEKSKFSYKRIVNFLHKTI
jgi:hypothetical protein